MVLVDKRSISRLKSILRALKRSKRGKLKSVLNIIVLESVMLAAAGRDIGQELINEIRLKKLPSSFLSWLHNARLRKTHSAQLLRKKSVRKKTITQIQRQLHKYKDMYTSLSCCTITQKYTNTKTNS